MTPHGPTPGAPRYGPGPIVRTHEGQDVFCRYGDPILAPESGTVSYSDGGLGGITARVHTSSSSYWYLTHLSDLNNEVYPGGSAVQPGDVIGFCGNSGNAASTPPHVHFGWYVNGKAKNPINALLGWLREAEARVMVTLTQKENKRIAQIDRLTTARFFGDWAGPDLSELDVSGESLWASGSSPATGAFGLAEAALQAALSDGADVSQKVVAGVADEDSAIETFLRPAASSESGDSD
ncbi:MAG: M23 family metallopeptidase [Actinobacteria bacterium]|nr:M23 family metallopeptidase [Actinomycetota bacterium]